jgi:hypothetical protein
MAVTAWTVTWKRAQFTNNQRITHTINQTSNRGEAQRQRRQLTADNALHGSSSNNNNNCGRECEDEKDGREIGAPLNPDVSVSEQSNEQWTKVPK